MTTTKKPDTLAHRPPQKTVQKPAPATSPKQQAARDRFTALVRSRSTAAAAPAAPAARTLAPRERPQKETIGSVVGRALPTAAAGFGLGMANGSKLGKNFEDRFNVKVSRPLAVIAGAAKLVGLDGFSPTLGRGASEVVYSELNDLARVGGESVSEMVGRLLDKPEEKTEAKTAPVDATPKDSIEVREASKSGSNGTSAHEYDPPARERERTVPRSA